MDATTHLAASTSAALRSFPNVVLVRCQRDTGVTLRSTGSCRTHDGLCWSADVLLHGKKVGTIADEGQGGDTMLHVPATVIALLTPYAAAYVATTKGTDLDETEISMHPVEQVQSLFCAMADLAETVKRVRRFARGPKVHFRTNDTPSGETRTVAHKGNPVAAVAWVRAKYPAAYVVDGARPLEGLLVINGVPVEVAVDLAAGR